MLAVGYFDSLTEFVYLWMTSIVKPEDWIGRLVHLFPIVCFTIGEVHKPIDVACVLFDPVERWLEQCTAAAFDGCWYLIAVA